MSAAYARLCAEVSNGARSGLDSYGATNPAEFFAVATETFFERPRHLQRWQPDLYAQLRDYYRLDPLAWQD
jgi:Mlc titration factor MtfA (ptsG expression regulator)